MLRFAFFLLAFSVVLSSCRSDVSSEVLDASKECLELSRKLGINVSKSECDAFEREFNAEQPERDVVEKKHFLTLNSLGEYNLDEAVTCGVASSMVSIPMLGQGLKAAGENAHNVSSFWQMAAKLKAPESDWSELIANNKLHSYIQDSGKGFMDVAMSEYQECAGRYSLALLSLMELSNG